MKLGDKVTVLIRKRNFIEVYIEACLTRPVVCAVFSCRAEV